MVFTFASVVEGHGEVKAVPILLQRIIRSLDPQLVVVTPPSLRCSRGSLLKKGGLEQQVEAAARLARPGGAVLVLADSDDDCPRDKAPPWAQRARKVRPDLPVRFVLAEREYEAWFLEAAPSLRGVEGLPDNLARPEGPADRIRGAKEWLGDRMSASYREPLHQPPLTRRFSLTLARRAGSFNKCYRDVVSAVREIVLEQPLDDQDLCAVACAARCDLSRLPSGGEFDPWAGLERFLLTGTWELSPDQQWFTFTRLREGIARWSIEEEPRHNGLWRAFRSLFLELCGTQPPARCLARDQEAVWIRDYQPHRDEYLELMREIDSETQYEDSGRGG